MGRIPLEWRLGGGGKLLAIAMLGCLRFQLDGALETGGAHARNRDPGQSG